MAPINTTLLGGFFTFLFVFFFGSNVCRASLNSAPRGRPEGFFEWTPSDFPQREMPPGQGPQKKKKEEKKMTAEKPQVLTVGGDYLGILWDSQWIPRGFFRRWQTDARDSRAVGGGIFPSQRDPRTFRGHQSLCTDARDSLAIPRDSASFLRDICESEVVWDGCQGFLADEQGVLGLGEGFFSW